MIKENIQDALNKQIMREMYSSNLYLAMSSWYAVKNLNGFAHWMRHQAEEEMEHAMKLFDYLLQRGGTPVVSAISEPKQEWASATEAFEDAYQHEQLVTGWINELMDLAISEKDHATSSMLKWFIDEQVEEEATVSEILEKIKLTNESPNGLFLIDRELKMRARG